MTYLLSDRSAHVTGQWIRFTDKKLHIVQQLRRKDPVVPNTGLDVNGIAEHFGTDLADALEVFPARRSIL